MVSAAKGPQRPYTRAGCRGGSSPVRHAKSSQRASEALAVGFCTMVDVPPEPSHEPCNASVPKDPVKTDPKKPVKSSVDPQVVPTAALAVVQREVGGHRVGS